MSKYVKMIALFVLILVLLLLISAGPTGCSNSVSPVDHHRSMTEPTTSAAPPPEAEPCNWRLVGNTAHQIQYFTTTELSPCDQPQVVNMRHHPTDPCLVGVWLAPGTNLTLDLTPGYPLGENCNLPIVVAQ